MDAAKMISAIATQYQSLAGDDMRGTKDDQDSAIAASRTSDTGSHAADGQPQAADPGSTIDDASPAQHRLSFLANAPAIDHPGLTSAFIEAKWTPGGQTCCSTGEPNTESTGLNVKYTMFLPGAFYSLDRERAIEPCKMEYPNLV